MGTYRFAIGQHAVRVITHPAQPPGVILAAMDR